jgi:ribosomal-protein-alanine N-acetyltransferase
MTKTPDRLFPELETARLRLREIAEGDLEWFMRHFSIPEICHGQGFPPPADLTEARQQLAQYVVDLYAKGEGLRWGIELKGASTGSVGSVGAHPAAAHPAASDDLIGSAGLYHWDREVRSAEAGYDLDPSYWGHGIMTEAMRAILAYGFEVMGLNRIQLLAMPRNGRSLALAERLGFVREGVLRDHGHDESGALVDDVMFSMLRVEWDTLMRPGTRR